MPPDRRRNIATAQHGLNSAEIGARTYFCQVFRRQSISSIHRNVEKLVIPDESAGQRLDNFLLARLKGVPKSHVYRLIRSGQVRVNGGRAKPLYRLAPGDQVRIPPVRARAPAPQPSADLAWLSERIIFEDERVLALNKPSGLAVHGGSGLKLGVIEALRSLRPQAPFLELAHRLDRSTSGCLIVAKKRSALRQLHELFREGQVEKRYLALVAGRWERKAGPLSTPLVTHERRGGERHVRVQEGGKEARSEFRAVDFFGTRATLLEVRIETGRMHQIRVQCAHLGHPIVGDSRYGDPNANREFAPLVDRLFLHAAAIALDWPSGDRSLAVSAPLPDDLSNALTKLEKK